MGAHAMSDIGFALRQLWRRPGISAIAVLTLAIGIGASTAIFSFVNGVLLQPMPYPGAERIQRLFHVNDAGSRTALSDPDFADLRQRSRSFTQLAQFGAGRVSAAGGDEPTRTMRALVTGDFLDALGTPPVRGRTFDAAELGANGPPAVIISARYWHRHFADDPDITRRTLRIDEREHAIVGVMPAGFNYPLDADLWSPLVPSGTSRTAHNAHAIGRLADGVTPLQARAELSAIAASLRAEHGDDSTLARIDMVDLHEHTVGALRPMLHVLLAAAVLLFLIAWANVANLLLARASVRRQELAVRTAVGAGRLRLARQFGVEAALLTGLGAVLGLLLAAGCIELMLHLHPGSLPRQDGVRIDGAVLAFVFALSLLSIACLSLLVAWRSGRDGFSAMANQRDAGGGLRTLAARSLVVGQVALALVLLVGAGLLARSFSTLLDVDPGFASASRLVMRLSLPETQGSDDAARHLRLHEALLADIRAMPGVERAGVVNLLPIADGRWNGSFIELARRDEVIDMEQFARVARLTGRSGLADYRIASDGYFETLGIPLVEGRLFDDGDHAGSPHVALVSQALARSRWPDASPLGKLIQFGNMDGILEPLVVVGVVGDVRESGLDSESSPTLYANARQRHTRLADLSYVIRTRGDPLALVPQLRQAVAAQAPDLPPAFTTLQEVIDASLAQRRLALVLVGGFGIAALLLALAGVYAAVAFSVSQRTREIGVRMAIGARGASVVGMVVGEGLRLAALGVAFGVIGAALLSRGATGLIHGIGSTDPVTFVLAPLLLLGAAAMAAWVPARRAAAVDPISALRSD
jgi:putative ABC transport system permease protein